MCCIASIFAQIKLKNRVAKQLNALSQPTGAQKPTEKGGEILKIISKKTIF